MASLQLEAPEAPVLVEAFIVVSLILVKWSSSVAAVCCLDVLISPMTVITSLPVEASVFDDALKVFNALVLVTALSSVVAECVEGPLS